MSDDLFALVVGTLLAVGALAFVLYPLFFGVPEHARSEDAERARPDDSAILALREIEFDRATGKLSESDYAELRATYAARALHEMRETNARAGDAPLDAVEARVRAFRLTHRECPMCGLRPEPDAVYCSTCGGYLERRCADCGAEITEPGAAFCSSCGSALARARASVLA